MRILVPLGTRPEIIKLAPVVPALRRRGFDVRVVATGQHHDPLLTDTFFDGLALAPDRRYRLSGDEADRVGAILSHAYRELATCPADLVLVLGDTHTVPLFALAARRHGVPVAHLEAGLRSFNPTSMEEVDRRVAAATASLHLAPTPLSARFLQSEGVPAHSIRVVGNPVLDVLRMLEVRARPASERQGVVMTAHRATNVDNPRRLRCLVDLARRLASEIGPLTFTVHPRTWARLEEAELLGRLQHPELRVLPPVAYREMLSLLAGARVVVTDSGGLQEEASWLGVPVVVLRRSTPRWESVLNGTAVVAGLDDDRALVAARRLASPEEQQRVSCTPCPYGDGHTAERVADVLADPAVGSGLRLQEPDFRDSLPPLLGDFPGDQLVPLDRIGKFG